MKSCINPVSFDIIANRISACKLNRSGIYTLNGRTVTVFGNAFSNTIQSAQFEYAANRKLPKTMCVQKYSCTKNETELTNRKDILTFCTVERLKSVYRNS